MVRFLVRLLTEQAAEEVVVATEVEEEAITGSPTITSRARRPGRGRPASPSTPPRGSRTTVHSGQSTTAAWA